VCWPDTYILADLFRTLVEARKQAGHYEMTR
jgi:hypothetical protein